MLHGYDVEERGILVALQRCLNRNHKSRRSSEWLIASHAKVCSKEG